MLTGGRGGADGDTRSPLEAYYMQNATALAWPPSDALGSASIPASGCAR
jgi:hypothetical protein